MENQTNYNHFIIEVKEQIVRSRYLAARLVNREQLLLYFMVGKQLSEKVASEKWGTKVIEQIAVDLQKELPGLKGFSYRNMMKMTQFYNEYSNLAFLPLLTAEMQMPDNQSTMIWQSVTAKLIDLDNSIGQLSTAQFEGLNPDLFFSVGFTQHIVLLNKCKDWNQRLFYLKKTVENHWTVEMLEWQIKGNLFQKQSNTIQSNFENTLPIPLQLNSTLAFKDEYLLDYINVETNDERIVEKGIALQIALHTSPKGTLFKNLGHRPKLTSGVPLGLALRPLNL
jgi:predicted nuclease of restriction endonuclease-like (RecB) superfamily